MKIITSIALSGTALASTALVSAVPAFAHHSTLPASNDAGTSTMNAIIHWATSPSHALFAIGGSIAAVLVIKYFASKRA